MKNRLKAKIQVVEVVMVGAPLFLAGLVVGYEVHKPSTVTVAAPTLQAAPTQTAIPTVSDPHTDFTFDNLLIKLNEARLANSLKQLKTDNYLSKYAQLDLENNCPVTSHDSFRNNIGKGVFRNYKEVGETLTSGSATPAQAVASFLSSPTHKDIILDPTYIYVGIGVATSPVNCVSFILGK